MTRPFDTYRGYVNTWECDDIGHMNVQFYVAKASEAGVFMRAAMGLPPSRLAAEQLGVIALEEHYRFHRELRAGDMLHIRSQLIELRGRTAVVFHEIVNSETGEPATTLVAVIGLFDLNGRELVPWPADVRARCEKLTASLPAHAQPRSVPREKRFAEMTLADAERLGLMEIYRGAVTPHHCDAYGHMGTQFYMSRYTDGAAHLWHQAGMDRATMRAERRGTVVLEMRLNFLREVRAGAMLIVRSAITEIMGRALRIAHFMFDGETGRLVATNEVAGILLDLDARKAAVLSEGDHDRLRPHLRHVDYAQ